MTSRVLAIVLCCTALRPLVVAEPLDSLARTAAEGNATARLDSLIAQGAAPDTRDTALVSLLLAHDADPAVDLRYGYTPLACAILLADTVIVDTLLSRGASVTDTIGRAGENTSPLMLAAALYQPSIVRRLLDRDADPNRTSGHGQTALAFATGGLQTLHNSSDFVRIIRPPLPSRNRIWAGFPPGATTDRSCRFSSPYAEVIATRSSRCRPPGRRSTPSSRDVRPSRRRPGPIRMGNYRLYRAGQAAATAHPGAGALRVDRDGISAGVVAGCPVRGKARLGAATTACRSRVRSGVAHATRRLKLATAARVSIDGFPGNAHIPASPAFTHAASHRPGAGQ